MIHLVIILLRNISHLMLSMMSVVSMSFFHTHLLSILLLLLIWLLSNIPSMVFSIMSLVAMFMLIG